MGALCSTNTSQCHTCGKRTEDIYKCEFCWKKFCYGCVKRVNITYFCKECGLKNLKKAVNDKIGMKLW